MKKIVTLSLIAVASLGLASCKPKEAAPANDTNVTDNAVAADAMADTNAAMDTNATDNASNAM
ncbi:hypothetical protein SAMN05444678_101320 [Sphingomonas sp. YR710]|jgi:hypothetical protein|uniref:hypothetical protein n=1 Tax=Sphingomonas sp. YR710 TaxID=1882773 RepID=UPI00056B14E4|nr:hypothetical protein [Sphingomonas sp. YR710]SDC08666.1 hypothetical protein SAMN05444678_101320 [Sphingomonas sp. YR710]